VGQDVRGQLLTYDTAIPVTQYANSSMKEEPGTGRPSELAHAIIHCLCFSREPRAEPYCMNACEFSHCDLPLSSLPHHASRLTYHASCLTLPARTSTFHASRLPALFLIEMMTDP